MRKLERNVVDSHVIPDEDMIQPMQSLGVRETVETTISSFEMYGGGGSACPCLRPLFGALAVGILKLFTGPLSMLGLYWTVFIFIGSESVASEYDTAQYRANGQDFLESFQSPYSIEVLRNIFYTFAVPACFPVASAICVFISIIKKDLKFLQWSLITNLVFIGSGVLAIILICSQGVKFLATLPLLAITMAHVYFLVVISLFKEWVTATNYYSNSRSPVVERPTMNKPSRPPPPPIPPRTTPRSIMAHSNDLYIFLSMGMALAYGFMDFDFPSDDIRNCQLNPYVCALLCGSANPSCDMTGHCSCYHRPSEDCKCAVPTIFEASKCNSFICDRKGTTAAVCSVNDEKYCVCAPTVPLSTENSNTSTHLPFSSEGRRKHFMFL
ncbi:unnamed protein product [Allacma fusca]|uniref:Uncharacterized protein n=1 Tax=Allacma fusca TaxID=39272 RepID=A0A8J2P7R9_9HEXA|nr:unnamed protein product [Allacma fusca]